MSGKNSNKIIWIVDDDEGILEVVQIVLQEEGYQVLAIQEERVLKHHLQKGTPDLILLDILLSGADGQDIARYLKQNKATQDIPVILMSADTHIEEKASKAGVNSFLKKPFNIADLEEMVKKYITL